MTFENHGPAVGATLPHRHGRIHAVDHTPPVTATKPSRDAAHRAARGTCGGCSLAAEDLPRDRVDARGEHTSSQRCPRRRRRLRTIVSRVRDWTGAAFPAIVAAG